MLSPGYPGNETSLEYYYKYCYLDIDTSARISDRPAIITPFHGGGGGYKALVWVGNWLTFFLQVVKRTNNTL